MAMVVSHHIWYPAGYPGTAYDLRQITAWHDVDDPTLVRVRFVGDPVAVVEFNKLAFETAKQDSLDHGG
jgi:hypothetical protein